MLVKPIDKLMFLDIETVPQKKSFYELSPTMQQLFMKRFKKDAEGILGIEKDTWDLVDLDVLLTDDNLKEKIEMFYNNKAPLLPEFGKIVCISIGWFVNEKKPEPYKFQPEDVLQFKTRSFYGADEDKLLEMFYEACASTMKQLPNNCINTMVTYNGASFDVPFIAKRTLMNFLPLPPYMDSAEMKPWDIHNHIDLKNVYKWGVYDANCSLALLCESFNVPTSKDDIDGSQVRNVFYEDNDLVRIAVYCEKDVYALALVYLRIKGIRNAVEIS